MESLINLFNVNKVKVLSVLCFFLILGSFMTLNSAIGEEAALPTYDSKGYRDPFVPLIKDGRTIGKSEPVAVQIKTRLVPVLYGILWDPSGDSVALVNDGEYQLGDTVGDYQVSEIRKDAVILRSGSEEVVLTINFESSSALSR